MKRKRLKIQRIFKISMILLLLLPVMNLGVYKVEAAPIGGDGPVTYQERKENNSAGKTVKIGYAEFETTVRLVSASTLRYNTVGWYFHFTVDGKTYYTLFKDAPQKYIEVSRGGSQATVQFRIKT